MQHFFQPQGHLKPIRRWAAQRGANIALAVDTFKLSVSLEGRYVDLTPRFSISTTQGLAYTHHYQDSGFVGWAPYEYKRWPLSSDKLAFKECFAAAGQCVPARLLPDQMDGYDFLVKGRHGSFGQGIQGPFRVGMRDFTASPLKPDEFCEQFIAGRAAKVWFWNAVPVAMERVEPPYLLGDGRRTVAELLASPRGSMDRAHTAEAAQPMLAWQGLAEHSVPEPGHRVLLGFKYVTPYDRTNMLDRDVLRDVSESLRAQLVAAGQLAYASIPADVRSGSLYTLDAVLDADDRAWWLEMNAHPMVHPQAYPAMLDQCFGFH